VKEHNRLKIAANLGVCDEVELISPCIQHLRAIGVDLIVVTDVASTDGTREILREFARDPDIRLIEISDEEDPWGFPERMYEWTISEFSVDRVLFIDADEFWLPRTGRLKETVTLSTADVLKVNRFNVPLVEGELKCPAILLPEVYNDIHFVTAPVAWTEIGVRPEITHSMTRVLPKVIMNPRRVAGFTIGSHGIRKNPDLEPIESAPDDLVIAHLPFSTLPRFQRKTDNIRKSLSRYGHRLVGGQARHWRRWLQLADEGKAEEEFRQQWLSRQQFEHLCSTGIVQSALQWFNAAPHRE
jgi:Glycosyl transferase family 2